MRLAQALALLLLAGCTVPTLAELGEKACSSEHPCATGYECVRGVCVIPQGGACTPDTTQPCGSAVGECRQGQQTCTLDRAWGACLGQVDPTAELCDGKDNDCNGKVDDNAQPGAACEKSQGVCATARRACLDGGFETPCTGLSYGSKYEPVERTCDGLDNDCNGAVDDGQTNGGSCADAGVCAGHTRLCTSGLPGVCDAPGFEAVETSCDGLDNDCDGLVDEGLSSVGPCEKTAGVCAGTHHLCVDAGFEPTCGAGTYGADYEVSETRCDGKDNDCDGVTDRASDGGRLTGSACELTFGVCTGAVRSCTLGAFESPCTAASYGAAFEAVEQSCDGLDNDCDDRADLSREVALVKTPSAATTHLSWAYVAGGYSAVYDDSRLGNPHVYFRRFDAQLRPVGTEVDLSATAAVKSYRPALAAMGGNVVATWVDELSTGVQRLVAAKLDSSGNLLFTTLADGGGTPTRVLISAPVSIFGSPRAAVSADGQYVFVAWVDTGLAARGSVLTASGAMLTFPMPLGSTGQVSYVSVSPAGGSSFAAGWTSLRTGSTFATFKSLPPALTPASALQEYSTAGLGDLRLARLASTGKLAAAWIEPGGGTVLRGSPDLAGAAPVVTVAGPTSESIGALDLAPSPSGALVAWSQGMPTPRLRARLLSGAATLELSPDGGAPNDAPSLAAGGTMVGVGFEADQGQGLDLYGELFCAP